MSNNGAFYITGRGGSLDRGLGAYLSERYGLLGGIGLSPTWLRKPHEDQVALVVECLRKAEAICAPVIANSYGSYLVMLALLDRTPLSTSVMLLSPVLGKTFMGGTYFSPAGSKRFAAGLSRPIEKPNWAELYMGEDDPGYVPDTWDRLLKALRPDKHALILDAGHGLPKALLAQLIEEFVEGHRLRRATRRFPDAQG